MSTPAWHIGQAVRTGAGYDAHIVEFDGPWAHIEYDDSTGVQGAWVLTQSLRSEYQR